MARTGISVRGVVSITLLLVQCHGFCAPSMRTSTALTKVHPPTVATTSPTRHHLLAYGNPLSAITAARLESTRSRSRVALAATTVEPVATGSPPPASEDDAGDLPDVIDILGVSFERWRKNDADGPASPSATGGAANGSKVDGDKMLLLYLPGIEGLGTSVEPQLPALSEKFDVFRLIIGAEDRSTFSTLSRAVTQFVDVTSGEGGGNQKKTVVLGESFGAMLGIRLGQLR
ncbi:unnamed protein product [Ectocarpus sp. 8 AP-2014]